MFRLKQFIQKFLKLKNKIKDNLSIYTAQLYLIESIDVTKFNLVYRPTSDLITIHTLYNNIIEYTIALKSFSRKIPTGEYIPVYDIQRDIKAITLKEWFIVNQTYIDPTDAIQSFLEASKAFLELYEHYTELPDKDFNTTKNLNNTKVIINNLFTILEELKNVQ